jgi:glycosyltransferase involved in cell wall biosynthesis
MVSEDLPHRSIGGLGRHLLTLSQSLTQAGHAVDLMGNNLVPFSEIKGDAAFLGCFYPELNMKHIGFKEASMGIFNPLRYPLIAWCFAREIMRRAKDYDVIHYHGHFPLLANHIPGHVNFIQTRHDQGSDCLIHLRFRNHDVCGETSPYACAHCATENPNAVQRCMSAGAVGVYRRLVARAFLRHKTIFVSDMLRRNFSRTAGRADWGCVIHNFVNFDFLRSCVATNDSRSELIEVFVASKLYEPKGVGAFLELVHTGVPSIMRITIAGDGVNEGDLRERYGRGRIVLLGWQSCAETIRRMSAADLVVIPSICEESCATTVLEALALGKKIFALGRGGTPELVKFQRYQGQLSLFENMSDLVDGVMNLNSKGSGHSISDEVFGADISHIRDEIVGFYLAGKRSSR